jgi:hypothetical protein
LMTGVAINAESDMDILSPSLVFIMVVLILIFTTFHSIFFASNSYLNFIFGSKGSVTLH